MKVTTSWKESGQGQDAKNGAGDEGKPAKKSIADRGVFSYAVGRMWRKDSKDIRYVKAESSV